MFQEKISSPKTRIRQRNYKQRTQSDGTINQRQLIDSSHTITKIMPTTVKTLTPRIWTTPDSRKRYNFLRTFYRIIYCVPIYCVSIYCPSIYRTFYRVN